MAALLLRSAETLTTLELLHSDLGLSPAELNALLIPALHRLHEFGLVDTGRAPATRIASQRLALLPHMHSLWYASLLPPDVVLAAQLDRVDASVDASPSLRTIVVDLPPDFDDSEMGPEDVRALVRRLPGIKKVFINPHRKGPGPWRRAERVSLVANPGRAGVVVRFLSYTPIKL